MCVLRMCVYKIIYLGLNCGRCGKFGLNYFFFWEILLKKKIKFKFFMDMEVFIFFKYVKNREKNLENRIVSFNEVDV